MQLDRGKPMRHCDELCLGPAIRSLEYALQLIADRVHTQAQPCRRRVQVIASDQSPQQSLLGGGQIKKARHCMTWRSTDAARNQPDHSDDATVKVGEGALAGERRCGDVGLGRASAIMD